MEKKANMKTRVFYKSTSVLGQIYDMADISTDNLGYSHRETMEYDRNFEFEGFEKYIDKWRGLLQCYNKEMNGASKGRQNEILVKYQKILKGIRKPLSQVLEEASAVYVVNHEHAMFNMERGYPPSLHFAMTIALPQLCDIYSRNVAEGGAAPYSSAPSVRNKLLRHS
jgi:RNA-dependent RNA polymerase